jgi:hypothetical protein
VVSVVEVVRSAVTHYLTYILTICVAHFVYVQMITGLPPFYSRNRETMFEKIMKAELNFPQQISEVLCFCVICCRPSL